MTLLFNTIIAQNSHYDPFESRLVHASGHKELPGVSEDSPLKDSRCYRVPGYEGWNGLEMTH